MQYGARSADAGGVWSVEGRVWSVGGGTWLRTIATYVWKKEATRNKRMDHFLFFM